MADKVPPELQKLANSLDKSASTMMKNSEQLKQWANNMQKLTKALDASSITINEQKQLLRGLNEANRELIKTGKDSVKSIINSKNLHEREAATFEALGKAASRLSTNIDKLPKEFQQEIKKIETVIRDFAEKKGAEEKAIEDLGKNLNEQNKLVADKLINSINEIRNREDQSEKTKEELADTISKLRALGDAGNAAADAMEAFNTVNTAEAKESIKNFGKMIDETTTSLKEAKTNVQSFSDAARKGKDAVFGFIGALESINGLLNKFSDTVAKGLGGASAFNGSLSLTKATLNTGISSDFLVNNYGQNQQRALSVGGVEEYAKLMNTGFADLKRYVGSAENLAKLNQQSLSVYTQLMGKNTRGGNTGFVTQQNKLFGELNRTMMMTIDQFSELQNSVAGTFEQFQINLDPKSWMSEFDRSVRRTAELVKKFGLTTQQASEITRKENELRNAKFGDRWSLIKDTLKATVLSQAMGVNTGISANQVIGAGINQPEKLQQMQNRIAAATNSLGKAGSSVSSQVAGDALRDVLGLRSAAGIAMEGNGPLSEAEQKRQAMQHEANTHLGKVGNTLLDIKNFLDRVLTNEAVMIAKEALQVAQGIWSATKAIWSDVLKPLGMLGATALLQYTKLGEILSAIKSKWDGKGGRDDSDLGGGGKKRPRTKGGKMLAGAGKFLKSAKGMGGLLSAGTLAYDLYDIHSDKTLTDGQKDRKYAGAGGAAGGAALGAALGTALIPIPVVGTMLGGIAGSYLGGKLGEQGFDSYESVFKGNVNKGSEPSFWPQSQLMMSKMNEGDNKYTNINDFLKEQNKEIEGQSSTFNSIETEIKEMNKNMKQMLDNATNTGRSSSYTPLPAMGGFKGTSSNAILRNT